MKTFKTLFILIGFISFAATAQAKVNLKKTQVLIMPTDISEPMMSAETVQKIQPKSVAPDESSSSVISKMVDNTVSYIWDASAIKQTSIGRAAEKVEKTMKAEVDLGKSANSKTEHKISVKLLAMQALAKLEYRGWVRAGINYDARAAKTEAEVSENIAKNNDLVLSHSISASEKKSQVSIRWNW